MKQTFILTFTAVILIFAGTNAQPRFRGDSQAMKKIEELEKIKIIDALKLDEQTTLRFFARRAEYKDNQDKLFKKATNLLDKMDDAAKKDGNKNNADFNKMIDEYLSISKQIVAQRNDFFKSLSDILTPEQIAKLLVFERKFREEIRNVLFLQRGHHPPN
jgi:Spy/CpxP family protein refolding chaperone